MNKRILRGALIAVLLFNSFLDDSIASPKNTSIFSDTGNEVKIVTVDTVEFIMDGGSIMFDCSFSDSKFRIVFQHPHKDQKPSFVRVLTIDDLSKPNLTSEILPGSSEEKRLVSVFTNILKEGLAPKFEIEIKTALKYISNRNLPWVSSDWVQQK